MANSVSSTETELLTYDEACGAKLALVEATGDLTENMNEVTNVSAPSSGAFAVGQFLTGPMIPAFTTITECLPSCAGATDAEALCRGRSRRHRRRRLDLSHRLQPRGEIHLPIPQPATDSQGNIYYGDPTVNNSSTVKKYAPNGEEIAFEHPITGGLTRPASVARDSVGNIYVAAGAKSCSSTLANGRLRVYKPNGEFVKNFPSEGSPLTEVTTVAVDKSTNEVFVGRGCHETFRVEKHSAGGAKLTEFGNSLFTGTAATNNGAYDQIAVDETDSKVYVADPNAGKVQVFEDDAPVSDRPGGHHQPAPKGPWSAKSKATKNPAPPNSKPARKSP